MSGIDAFLLELFREEVASHSAALTEGLLSLERQGCTPQAIEPLMRAAHSIKGAARVLDLNAAVQIAHVMEDVLVAAGAGRVRLDAAGVDALLGAVDWLLGMSQVGDGELLAWLEQHAAEAQEWERRIGALAVEAEPLPLPQGEGRGEGDAKAVAFESPLPSPLPAPSPLVASPPAEEGSIAAPAEEPTANERSVKITADILDQLVAYASETLVETHRLEPCARSVQNLKRLQRRLSGVLAEAPPADPAAAESAQTLLLELRHALDEHSSLLDDFVSRGTYRSERLYRTVLAGRMRPFADGVAGFPRLVRDLARQLGKQVQLHIAGRATRVDRDILERLEAPLNHLLRNALDHGIETPEERLAAGKPAEALLRLEAHHRSGRLTVTVSDDGRGIDLERLRLRVVERGLAEAELAQRLSPEELYDFLFLPGFSTRDQVSDISGRGVGLDVVQTMVHACGGALRVSSAAGKGTRFQLQLPVTRSVLRVLLARIAGEVFALPLARIERAGRLACSELRSMEGHHYCRWDGDNVAVVSAAALLGRESAVPVAEELTLVFIAGGWQRYALAVDGLLGECELVVRPLDDRLGKVPNLGAMALSEQGEPLLILDVDDLLRSAAALHDGRAMARRPDEAEEAPQRRKRVLVVDDSLTVREVERKLLENDGYEVDVAVDGVEGWNALQLQRYDLVLSDVDMPRMNGIELVRRIKQDPRLQGLPVVIVSYKDRPEDRLRGLEAGADYYLTKSSFQDAGLIQAVRDLIGAADSA
ncbi:hybrid sensor histidine kinase/response regulator [Methylogaea oryzae]|uniref:Chemotaxis protein CheA n=2 Tax=Methylogaea oryzae TaxID=1295382 RepID=A0A8D4VN58_9GAMM|nr:hybrid sensor histidine kinase/response regulator [Methylogaea oryzae]BBL69619.1 hybrid sensor histidine kinase/response regulator [Methylogaea oryzae]